MSEKYNAALGAYELIAKGKEPLILGIGTGSTADQFTEHFLPKLRKRINEVFSSSVDESKIVKTLGKFPLPIEIDINQNDKVLFELKKYSKTIVRRELLSDNNNYIYDLHDFKISDPKKIETEILSITGVVDVGIFAINKPQIVIVGENSSYRLIES